MKNQVVIIGSLNIDYIATVESLPRPGQTLSASGLVQLFGGKGANQAVAAARQGAATAIIGCVGNDGHGTAYLERMAAEGIDCKGLCRSRKALTGTALIAVDRKGENNIIVAAGANGMLSPAHVRRQAGMIRSASAVLAQFEVPMPAILEAFSIGQRASVPLLLNPSPIRQDFPWGKFQIDTLIVNEGEANALLGAARERSRLDAMRRMNIQRLVVTRGGLPTLLFADGTCTQVPTLRVTPLDTVGAGDAFAGAYTAWRAAGADLVTAIRHANVAGALSTLKHGAQESMPTKRATIRQAAIL